MPLSGEEIRHRLVAFAAQWSVYDGSERAEAQTFLNELFACYGTNRGEVARFEEPGASGVMDLIWPEVCLIEMKRPSEASRLPDHRDQAFGYWRAASDPDRGVPAPRYVVICAFRRLEIWEPGAFPAAPRVELDLVELPDHYEALLFLAGREPVYVGRQEAVTRKAVGHIVELYQSLRERKAADLDVLRDFIFQSVWCMFAEDLGQLEAQLFTRLVDRMLRDQARSSVDELGQLFAYLNDEKGGPTEGLYAGVPFANGGLFEHPARVHLDKAELEMLRRACDSDWKRVQPSIFGSLMEGGLGHDAQWALGAHYTHEADIRKVVGPSIVEPWIERIENITTHAEAVAAQNDLLNYVVLDPACGSGNFLYVAYRELRRVESRLRKREAELRRRSGMQQQAALSLFFSLENIKGIEVDRFAASVARVTLWMGHRLAVEELKLNEATLPLAKLSGIQVDDALRVPWPRADVVIGNPPFHGDRYLRRLRGDAYVEWLKREFGVGIKDYCVYWFRKAHDHLELGQRAGLVGTNSVTQNRARGASLQYILDTDGTITDAVSTQDWPGEAAVDVSIVNWIKGPTDDVLPRLDGVEVDEPIAASLRPWSIAVERSERLPSNEGFAFYGPIPGAAGFVLDKPEAEALLEEHPEWTDIIRPYLIGDDILNRPDQAASRFIIDFGYRSLEEAMTYPDALAIVRERVKPQRDKVRRATYRENWWRFSEPIREMREALNGKQRYLAGPAQGKRILFTWVDPWTCPSNLTTVFAFDSDYAFGVLTSSAHTAWTWAQSSTLEDRTRYTTTSVFDTFPWPDPDDASTERIAQLGAEISATRNAVCSEAGIGLTRLYNLLEDGAYKPLRELHHALDLQLAVAYGWTPDVASDQYEIVRRLLDLNLSIAAGRRDYAGPGE